MGNQPLLHTFPLVLMAGVIISFVTTPLIYESLDLRDDHENQCRIYNILKQLKVSPPGGCPYDKVTDLASTLMMMGSIFLCLVILFLGVMWVLIICSPKCQRLEIGILGSLLAGAAVALVVIMAINYKDLYDFKKNDEGMNWKTLESDMKSSLVKNFLSDNITSANETSNQWNIMFIEYKCCGVDRINGTTNDFDTSPWCTTSGSCQQTNSQIPKACCRGVTEEDYQSADKKCHAEVTNQTYNDQGCYSALKEKITEERTQHTLKIKQVLREGMTVLIAMGVCIILSVFGIVGSVCGGISHNCKQESPKTEKSKNGRDKPQTEEHSATNQTKM